MNDHAPAFEHLGSHHARWGSVEEMSQRGRPHRGRNAQHGEVDLRLRIDVVPLADPDLVHVPHKTVDIVRGDLHDREIGAWGGAGEKGGIEGAGGGPAGTASGASAKRAWAAPPSHNPTLPTTPFPTHNTWSTLGQSQLDKSSAMARASGGGVHVRDGLVVAVLGVGGPQLKRSPLQPIHVGVREGVRCGGAVHSK